MTARKTALIVTLVASLAIAGTALGKTHRIATHPRIASPATTSTTTLARAQAATALHRFRGRVTSADRSHRTFRMRTTTNKSVRIHTNNGTHWDDCNWGDMDSRHHVDVHAYRHNGTWVAARMQNSANDDHDHHPDHDGGMMR